MELLREAFANPPAAYRSAPLWVWNDQMCEEQITFQLNELKTHGFGGAFVHPRPGLITEYLSEEWFRLWDFALQTAKGLDIKLYIYDENSYPSGFAGGHVSSSLPDCLASGITYKVTADPREVNGKPIIKAFSCTKEGEGLVIREDITLYPCTEWSAYGDTFFVVMPVKPQTTGWLAGFAYVDLLRPEVTELFLQTTYEAYYKRFGSDFGDSIPAIFTDEPYLGSGGVYGDGAPALPFSYWLANEFEVQHGYNLLANLPCIFKNLEGAQFRYPAEKVRYDYYTTLHTLWTKNFVEPMGKWCKEHNIAWTGHYLEHQWPFAYAACPSPALQSHYEYHQWPAIDMLLSNYLRDTESHALTLTIQEIRSAANQFKKERTLCELYGAGGWDSTFEDYKRMGDWVLVNGINFINQHLTYCTITGARKRDHPQSFDWREPWWNEYTQMNDYLGRVSYLLSQGMMQQRILVLNPTTSGYLIPYEEERGSVFSGAGTDAIRNPDMQLFLETLQSLTNHQWDYDLGDEYTMQRHASVENGKLRVGEQHYEVVVVPGDMKNMLKSTASLLSQLMKSGGCVISCGNPGSYIDGLRDSAAYDALCNMWTAVESPEALNTQLQAQLTTRIASSAPWVTGVTHMRRLLDDGREIYFFVNHHMSVFETSLTLHGTFISQWNLFSGKVEPVRCEVKDGRVTFGLSLQRNQSVLLVVGGNGEETPASVSLPDRDVPLSLASIRAETPNMLPVSYCNLKMNGQTYEDIHVIKAADLIYAARGFDGNPWDNKVQYRNNLMDRNHFGPSSGFEAVYSFTAAEDFVPQTLYAVAEQPTLCRLLINGHPVEWMADRHSLDHHFGMADIAAWVMPGENRVSIIADRFDVRMELETLYLSGDFSVKAVGGKWVLAASVPLQYGTWKSQGSPFYSGAVIYRYLTELNEKPKNALLNVQKYTATALSLTVNGQYAGLIGADGIKPVEISHLLRAGKNEIAVRVCGSLKNLLGPHFMKESVRGSAWPAMWKDAPTFRQPSPDAYDLLDFGLAQDPILIIG